MKNSIFLFLFFAFGIQKVQSQGCSFTPKIIYNECGSAILGAMECSDCITYTWNTGAATQYISVMTSGTYTVTVGNNNGCTSKANIYVQVALPCDGPGSGGGGGCSFDVETNTTQCGQSTLTVVDCPDCYEYSWNNGATTKSITVFQGGTYTVTVKGGGGACTSTLSKMVSVTQAPTVQIQGNTTFCEGESTTLTAVGSTSCTYLWSNGATTKSIDVTNAGTYTVTVYDIFGCSSTATVHVTKSQKTETPTITSTVVGETVILTASPTSSQYMWSNGSTSQTIVVTKNSAIKLFTVKVKNNNGCWSDMSCQIPVIFVSNNCGDGDGGNVTCAKNVLTVTNGMPYGAIITRGQISSQDRIMAPPYSYDFVWNGQTSTYQSRLVNTSVGKHLYRLEYKVNGIKKCAEFEYTIIDSPCGGCLIDKDGNVIQKIDEEVSLDYFSEENLEEEDVQINPRSSKGSEIILDQEDFNVFPNPTYGPVRIEADMEIPEDAAPSIYIISIMDIYGKVIQTKKVMKQ